MKFSSVFTLITTFVFSALSTLSPSGAVNYPIECMDIVYGEYERNVMDIYLPTPREDEGNYGAILFIHGGSWTSGDKSSETLLCKEYAKKGYVTATISYHYIDSSTPVSVNMTDIELSIKKLQSYCGEKGYNVTNLALHGYSSGAHISTLFAYSCPEKSAIPLSFVVNMAGPADFNSDTWNEWDYNKNTGPSLAFMLYGRENIENDLTAEKTQEIIDNVSPVSYINGNTIPTICGYSGDGKDGIVPTKNKTITFEKLTEHNVTSALFTFENSNHFLISDPATRKALYEKVDEYCKTYFGY